MEMEDKSLTSKPRKDKPRGQRRWRKKKTSDGDDNGPHVDTKEVLLKEEHFGADVIDSNDTSGSSWSCADYPSLSTTNLKSSQTSPLRANKLKDPFPRLGTSSYDPPEWIPSLELPHSHNRDLVSEKTALLRVDAVVDTAASSMLKKNIDVDNASFLGGMEKGSRNDKPRGYRKKKTSDGDDSKNVLLKKEQFHKDIAHSNHTTLPPWSSADFPSLGTTRERVVKLKDPFPRLDSSSYEPPDCIPSVTLSNSHKLDARKETTLLRVGAVLDTTAGSKLKKSKRPIHIDFTSFLRAKGRSKQRKPDVVDKKVRFRKGSDLAGNSLDSSKPIRSKGKFRERKNIKLSRLKTEIIKDRILKSIAVKSYDGTAMIENVDFKKEIKIYLNQLKEEKEKLKINKTSTLDKKQKLESPRGITVFPPNSVKSFSSKFRSYCENILTPELNSAVKELVQSLVQLQDRAFARDPLRARAHKRFVTGLREANKYLKLKRVKLLIIAPDLEASAPDGALSKCVTEMKEEAKISSIPCVFALDRRKLGYSSLRKAPVSAFAVLSYEGLEVAFQKVKDALEVAQQSFVENFPEQEKSKLSENSDFVSTLLEKLKIDHTTSNSNPSIIVGNDE